MPDLHSPQFWGRLAEIGFLNLLLSGDNAVVIALAVRALPARQRVLGQIWGTVGAVVLRLAFVGVVGALLRVPFLRLAGGALLVWIAVKLVRPASDVGDAVRGGASFWEAMWIIIVADLTMSLDNVLAIAAAAHEDLVLVGLGIASSLPVVVLGSDLLARLMGRHVWIIWLGGGILGYVAADMILEDPLIAARLGPMAHVLDWVVPVAAGICLTGLGYWLSRPPRRPSPEAGPVAPARSPRPPR